MLACHTGSAQDVLAQGFFFFSSGTTELSDGITSARWSCHCESLGSSVTSCGLGWLRSLPLSRLPFLQTLLSPTRLSPPLLASPLSQLATLLSSLGTFHCTPNAVFFLFMAVQYTLHRHYRGQPATRCVCVWMCEALSGQQFILLKLVWHISFKTLLVLALIHSDGHKKKSIPRTQRFRKVYLLF